MLSEVGAMNKGLSTLRTFVKLLSRAKRLRFPKTQGVDHRGLVNPALDVLLLSTGLLMLAHIGLGHTRFTTLLPSTGALPSETVLRHGGGRAVDNRALEGVVLAPCAGALSGGGLLRLATRV